MRKEDTSGPTNGPADNAAQPHPGVTTDDEMTFEEAVKILELKAPLTKEPVSPEELLETLKDDVVWAVRRPGSWEGANMTDVLTAHGFLMDSVFLR